MAKGIRHVEQQRARWALDTVRKLAKSGNKAELTSHIRKLPSHIQTSGLAQTLLFYGQKQEALARALVSQLGLAGNRVADAVRDLVESPARLRLKTREAMAAAQWLKRFAEVELRDQPTGKDAAEGGS